MTRKILTSEQSKSIQEVTLRTEDSNPKLNTLKIVKSFYMCTRHHSQSRKTPIRIPVPSFFLEVTYLTVISNQYHLKGSEEKMMNLSFDFSVLERSVWTEVYKKILTYLVSVFIDGLLKKKLRFNERFNMEKYCPLFDTTNIKHVLTRKVLKDFI